MNFLQHHLVQIIDGYEAPQPLHLFLKQFFAANKKLGSRDRRSISEAVFLYYRLLRFYESTSPLAIIDLGIKLRLTQNQYLIHTFESFESQIINEVTLKDFPELSEGIELSAYLQSLRHQPKLFIRLIRHQKLHKQLLQRQFQDITFYDLPVVQELVVALPNSTKLQDVLPETDYIVQDYASQQVIPTAVSNIELPQPILKIWDVCSGAGGKTIMAKTIWNNAYVLASDIRGNILKNLQVRLKNYGLKNVQTLVLDASQYLPLEMKDTAFDMIICDVPCSGSGTWARTPEQFAFFKNSSIANYSELQFQITKNALQKLNESGVLIYITCSIFKEENERVIERILQEHNNIECVRQQLINGLEVASDSMFYAVLKQR